MPAKMERRSSGKTKKRSSSSLARSKPPKKKPTTRKKSVDSKRKTAKEKEKKPKRVARTTKTVEPKVSEVIIPQLEPISISPRRISKDALNNLEEIYGLRGPKYLHKALTTCQDPQEMLQQFRTEEGILVPTLRPAVAMLDLMEVSRHEFHIRCAEQLRQELIDRITLIAQGPRTENHQTRLQELLDKCYTGLNLPLVRPVVLQVLKNLTTIDEKYKNEIMENKELYDVCEIPLKRQIWIDRNDLFEAEMAPLMNEWIANRIRSMFEISPLNSLYTIQGNIRRQDVSLLKMVENVGETAVLYELTKKLIRTRYLETASPHYGTLRLDFLILMHERHAELITSTDNQSYKFAFLMDASVRARYVDSKRSKEITFILDSLKKESSILRDVAMIISDPQIAYFNATSAMRLAQAVVNQGALPRDNPMLLFFLRLLSFSLHAMDYIEQKLPKEAKFPAGIICEFLPTLCALMVSISAQNVNKEKTKLPVPQLEWLVPTLKQDPIAVWLVTQWVAYLLRQNDQEIIIELIRLFPQFSNQMLTKDELLVHNMVIQLAHTPQEQHWSTKFADCIFHEYLHAQKPTTSESKHCLRLMYYVYPKLDAQYRDEILTCIEKVDDLEVKNMYNMVRSRIATSVPVNPILSKDGLTPVSPTNNFAFTPKHT